MDRVKNNFMKGLIIGFLFGSFIVLFGALGAGFLILKNPHGSMAEAVLHTAHSFVGYIHPHGSVKQFASSTVSKLKDPELRIKYPFSFQTISFPGNRVERSGSLTSWISPFSDRVSLDESPPSKMIHKQGKSRILTLEGLKGETLSFQLVLRANETINNIKVSVTPDPTTDMACIQIHRFKEIYLKVMQKQDDGTLKKIENADPLLPFNDPYSPGHRLIDSFSLRKNKDQPIWIDIRFSDTCQSGNYSGTLRITRLGSTIRKTPITFHIINATLPHDVGLDRWMQLYTGRFIQGESISNDTLLKEMLGKYFVMAHNYGFATSGCGTISPVIQWNGNKIASIDWARYDSLQGAELSGDLTGTRPNEWCFPMEPDQVGTTGGFTYQTNTPSDIADWKSTAKPFVEEMSKAFVKHWKEKGWSLKKAFVYVWDEPDHQLYYPNVYQVIAFASDAIHEATNNQLKIMLTDAPYIWNRHQSGHHKNDMYDKIDIWAPSGTIYIPDKFKTVKESGKKTWFYQGAPPFTAASDITGTGPGFRMWFWTAWKYNVKGLFYWASDFWSGNAIDDNPYKHGGVQDGVMFYPGRQLHFLDLPDIDGPLPSVRMAQWRRGYEDYKYFVMLKNKGETPYVNHLINKIIIKALDDGGYIPYWRHPLWHRPGNWDHDPKVWHKARLKLAKKIEKLYSSSK